MIIIYFILGFFLINYLIAETFDHYLEEITIEDENVLSEDSEESLKKVD